MLGFPNTSVQALHWSSPPVFDTTISFYRLNCYLPHVSRQGRRKRADRLGVILQLFGLGQNGVDIRDWVILKGTSVKDQNLSEWVHFGNNTSWTIFLNMKLLGFYVLPVVISYLLWSLQPVSYLGWVCEQKKSTETMIHMKTQRYQCCCTTGWQCEKLTWAWHSTPGWGSGTGLGQKTGCPKYGWHLAGGTPEITTRSASGMWNTVVWCSALPVRTERKN